MKILVHDYSGHPFQMQLSRELARRGHSVHHVFSAGFQTPKGQLIKNESDPETLEITGISFEKQFQKYSYITRRSQEIKYGNQVGEVVKLERPDVVISSNTPLDAQRCLQKAAREAGIKFIFWLQDIYSEGIGFVIKKKFPGLGHLIAFTYRSMEYSMLRKSDAVIAITDDFVPILTHQARVSPDRITTIENWAPLDEMAVPRNSIPDEVRTRPLFVYTGTLGHKHNPEYLLMLAQRLDADLHVYSEGQAADWLRVEGERQKVTNLKVRPWVSFEDLPGVLYNADVFVAMIEQEAGIFCVPSKVLTYMCIGKPILASVPKENLAARIIVRENAGLVSQSSSPEIFIKNAEILARDAGLRNQMGANSKKYSELEFQISKIVLKFEDVIQRCM